MVHISKFLISQIWCDFQRRRQLTAVLTRTNWVLLLQLFILFWNFLPPFRAADLSFPSYKDNCFPWEKGKHHNFPNPISRRTTTSPTPVADGDCHSIHTYRLPWWCPKSEWAAGGSDMVRQADAAGSCHPFRTGFLLLLYCAGNTLRTTERLLAKVGKLFTVTPPFLNGFVCVGPNPPSGCLPTPLAPFKSPTVGL